MAVVMEDWSRPAFEPGGGDATLFYLAFGALGPVRLPPTPAGLSLSVHPQGEAVWVEPLVAGSADAIDEPQLAALVRGAPDFAVLRGRRTDPPDLGHLRDAEAVLAALLEAGAAAVLDVEARRWWTPEEFRREVLTGLRPAVRAHVSVRARQGLVETRGLRKFGRPDLRFLRVPPEEEPEALRVCWSLVERLARGARPGPGLTALSLRLQPSSEAGHPALEAEWSPPSAPPHPEQLSSVLS
jgi:hypothetical protein